MKAARKLIIKTLQAITSVLQVKGAPKAIVLAKRTLFRSDGPYSVYNGIQIQIDPTVNFHCLNVLHYSGYENVKTYERFLKKGDVYVDVGANLGYMSINAEKIVGREGKVISLEPDPNILPLLKKNKQINNSQIMIVEKAATDQPGVAQFHVATESGLSRLSNEQHNLFGMELLKDAEVPTDTLDNIVSQLIGNRPVDLIKIDVEGHELKVLRGAGHILTTYKPVLFLEINHGALEQNYVTLNDIIGYLAGFSYDFYYVNSHAADWLRLGRAPTYTRIDRTEKFMAKPFDLLCVPAGAKFRGAVS